MTFFYLSFMEQKSLAFMILSSLKFTISVPTKNETHSKFGEIEVLFLQNIYVKICNTFIAIQLIEDLLCDNVSHGNSTANGSFCSRKPVPDDD